MKAVLDILWILLGLATSLCFVGGFAAHILLQFYIDHRRVLRDTGEPGWKIFGSLMASAECYKPHAEWLWKARRRGCAGFIVAVGALVIVGFLAAALGIPLG